MSARLSRRTLLAGLAAMPTLALVGCDDDRTTAGPISTAGTLDFANRLLAHGSYLGELLRRGVVADDWLSRCAELMWHAIT